jgi:hypothetical protein
MYKSFFFAEIGLVLFLGNLGHLSSAEEPAKAKKHEGLRESLWFQKYLRAMKEPSLRRLAEKDRTATVYRFLWLPSFHDPISVRFVKSDEGVTPIADSEPVSIVKPEPPVAAGQGSGSQARTTTWLGTHCSARNDGGRGMWRGGMSPIRSRARTIPVKDLVVGWATAESPAAGCGAGRDRMTSVLSRSSWVSRWRRWIRAWGRDEPVTDDPAA